MLKKEIAMMTVADKEFTLDRMGFDWTNWSEEFMDEVLLNPEGFDKDFEPSIWDNNNLRAVLIAAWKNNNKRLINKAMCKDCEVPEALVAVWQKAVGALYKATWKVVKDVWAGNAPDYTEMERYHARCTVFGSTSSLESTIPISLQDCKLITGFIFRFGQSEVGTTADAETRKRFRKAYESLLGCKIAGLSLLSEDDVKVKNTYRGVLRAIEVNTELIGNIEAEIDTIKNEIAIQTELLTQLNATEEQTKSVLTPRQNEVERLEKELADAKKTLDKANKTKAKYADAYKELMDRIESMGIVADLI